MPFDATPAEIPFEVRTLPERRTALRNLAWLLRNRKPWPAGFKWDYWYEESCAIGLCRKYYGDDVYNVIARNRGAVQQIFYGRSKKISPSDIARSIDISTGNRRCRIQTNGSWSWHSRNRTMI